MTAQTITPGMPEPEGSGVFLIEWCDGDSVTAVEVVDGEWLEPGSSCRLEWDDFRAGYLGAQIEFLADHDRKIARKAWEQGANDWSWYQTRIPDEPVPENPYETKESK